MISHCTDTSDIVVHLLGASLTAEDESNITAHCEDCGFLGSLVFHAFDAEADFGHLRSLHGDWTSYGRLLIPERIDASEVLYLDADLLITLDIMDLANVDLGDNLVAGCSGSTLSHRIDFDLLRGVGCPPDMPYVDAGVLLINSEAWRTTRAGERWRSFAAGSAEHLTSHDQSIINYLCMGKFTLLPRKYNTPWVTLSPPQHPDGKIVHFVGSPKPWDLSGKQLHTGYRAWRTYQTAEWASLYGNASNLSLALKRTWSIRKSIARNINKRLRPPASSKHEQS